MAGQAGVRARAISLDARPRHAVARELAALELAAHALEQGRVGRVGDVPPVGIDGLAVEAWALGVGRVPRRMLPIAKGRVAAARVAADVDCPVRGQRAMGHVSDKVAEVIFELGKERVKGRAAADGSIGVVGDGGPGSAIGRWWRTWVLARHDGRHTH